VGRIRQSGRPHQPYQSHRAHKTMITDLRYAVRWLLRSPGFAAIAVLSLGLGIGVNTAMFSLVDAVLLRPIPVEEPETLVDIFTSSPDGDLYATSSYPDFLDLKAQNTVFTDMLGYSPMFAPLNLGDRARLVMGHIVTSNHFVMLGVRPHLGRVLHAADDEPGADRVVVISHRMWQRDFGSDPAIVGRALRMRGLDYTIVGVAPKAFTGVVPMLVPELWLPVAHVEEVEPAGINSSVPSPTGNTRLERRGSRWLFVKGRLKPGVTAVQAHANVALVGAQLSSAHPATNNDSKLAAFPTNDVRLLVPQASGPLSIGSAALMTVVGLVLLIACANVAGMLLARASSRRREMSIRLAIGASRRQIVRQMLVEGVVLGLCGAVVATALAWAVVQVLTAIPLPIPGAIGLDLRIDWRVVTFAAAVAVAAGLLASLTPALKATSPRLTNDLRGDSPLTRAGARRWSLREALVVAQLALTAVLLVVAGLLLRTLGAAQSADVGFRTDGLALVSVDTAMVRYSTDRSRQFFDDALAAVKAMPGVESAAFVTPRLPFDINFSQTTVQIEGKTYESDTRGEVIANVAVTPDYFATLGIPIVEGRGFTEADRDGAPLVAVINETMARRFWPSGSAVGRTVRLAYGGKQFQIVGVAGSHKVHSVGERPTPYLHFAAAQQSSRYNTIVARTRGDASALLAAMRRELLGMEPGLVFIRQDTMEATMATSLLPERISALLATAFGGLGTLLAAIGLYGVIAYSVARRTREIGIRVALGAHPSQVLGMVMRQGLTVAVIGGVLGAALAAFAARLLSGVIYGVGAADPVAWSAAFAALLVAAALANYIPARRAMRVDPVTALRVE
jgi:predicted permease